MTASTKKIVKQTLSVARDALFKALSAPAMIAKKNSGFAEWERCQIKANTQSASISAANRQILYRTPLPAEWNDPDPIDASVETQKLVSLLNGLEASSLQLKFEQDKFIVKTDKGRYSSQLYRNDQPAIVGILPEPLLQISANHLINGLSAVRFAVKKNDTGEVVENILLEIDEEARITFTATDGYTLANTHADSQSCRAITQGIKALMPAEAADVLLKTLPPDHTAVSLYQSESYLTFAWADSLLRVALAEGRFADYRNVLPEKTTPRIVVSKTPLMAMLRRLIPFSDADTRRVQIDQDGDEIVVFCQNPDFSHFATDVFQCKVIDPASPPLSIAFDGKKLMAALTHVPTEEVAIQAKSSTSPAILRSPDETQTAFMLLMPLDPLQN